MLMEADMIRTGTAERIARLSDEAPGAEMAARGVLAQVCARAGWDAARIELRTGGERRPLWDVRPRRPPAGFRAPAEERRRAPSFLYDGLAAGTRWKKVERRSG